MGLFFLTCLPAGIVLLLVAEPPAGVIVGTIGLCGPYLLLVIHLNATHLLSSQEKAVWRRELWASWRSLPAVWVYALCRDLRETTRQWAETA